VVLVSWYDPMTVTPEHTSIPRMRSENSFTFIVFFFLDGQKWLSTINIFIFLENIYLTGGFFLLNRCFVHKIGCSIMFIS
jgi:hypothetical protein